MATIRKTVSGLKPDSNYLFAVKPKNTEISASDSIPDSIRIKTPSSTSIPSTITSFNIYCNFESVMFVFQPVTDQDFSEYEYEIYDGSTTSSNLVSTGRKRSTVFVVSVENSSRTVDPSTNAETVTNKKYYGRVRAINTSGNAGAWTALVTHSGNIPLIADQYIGSLTAAKITSGLITAQEIILQQPSGTTTSYTPPSATSVLRSSNYVSGPSGTGAGWLIRGDGYAEFDATNIRGSLTASSIALNTYNYWRSETSPGTGYEFEVGNGNDKLLKWNTTTGVLTIKGQISGGSVGGLSVDTGKIYLGGTGDYDNVNTAFYVDSAGKFSLKRKLTWDGNTLTIDGTVTIGGSTASTVVANANGAIQSGGAATDINNNTTTISGGKITANTINVDRLIAGTLTGYRIQNAASNQTFLVTSDGNVAMNNILATGSLGGSDTGLQIRADGYTLGSGDNAVTATSGSIFIYHGSQSTHQIRLGESTQYFYINQLKNQTEGPVNVTRLQSSTNAIQIDATYTGIGGRPSNARTLFVHGDILLGDEPNNDYLSAAISANSVAGQPIHYKTISGGTGLLGFTSLRSGKNDIKNIDDPISIIKKLQPRQYTVKPDEPDNELEATLKSLDINYGFVAEEIEESVPHLAVYKATKKFQDSWPNVDISDIMDFELVYYKETAILSLCVATIQNLLSRIENLESHSASQ
jgi:hypothetical protein